MKQRSFSLLSFEVKKKPTRRKKFVGEKEVVVSWAGLLALIELSCQDPPPHSNHVVV
jgi:hypothetical protein